MSVRIRWTAHIHTDNCAYDSDANKVLPQRLIVLCIALAEGLKIVSGIDKKRSAGERWRDALMFLLERRLAGAFMSREEWVHDARAICVRMHVHVCDMCRVIWSQNISIRLVRECV